MRRFVTALIALAVVGALFATAGGASAARIEICPLGGSFCCVPTPTVLPCCEPTVVSCPTKVTISATPNPAKALQAVTITGQVSSTVALSGATVTLWQALPGQKAFADVGQSTTSSTGAYSFTRPVGTVATNRSWYVTAGTAQSTTVVERVSAAITLSASSLKSGNGELVSFVGKVKPSHAGERIRLERRAGKAWITFARVRLSRTSSFRLHRRFQGFAATAVRAVLGADRKNIRSYSTAINAVL